MVTKEPEDFIKFYMCEECKAAPYTISKFDTATDFSCQPFCTGCFVATFNQFLQQKKEVKMVIDNDSYYPIGLLLVSLIKSSSDLKQIALSNLKNAAISAAFACKDFKFCPNCSNMA